MKKIDILIFRCLSVVMFTFFVASSAFAQNVPLEIPFVKEWGASPHARTSKEAFTHWDKEGQIPKACARCHSTAGFQDYLGVDGSAAGKVDHTALPGSGITCVACHNEATLNLTEVTFPSGAKIERLTPDSRCMMCHQGRESTVSVNNLVKKSGAGDDKVSKKLKFLNIHYRAAAATRFGTEVKGGYEYAGKKYAGLYLHDEQSTLCIDCHDNHTLQITVDRCTECHKDVKKRKDYQSVRTSKKDFDGNGNVKEGIAKEIKTLHVRLNSAIQTYAKGVAGKAIIYDSHQYPYFFTDKNSNAKVDKGEAIYPNRYQSWTPRLLRAAYNYQYIAKDPGAYTHNPSYSLQLLHDSLVDLGTKVKVDTAKLVRP